MKRPRICAVVTRPDPAAIREVTGLTDLFEVRIDLIGAHWTDIIPTLGKPWIATNRLMSEGGEWHESESRRQEELLKALELGAYAVDMELATPNLEKLVPRVRRVAQCLISYHNTIATPSPETLSRIVREEIKAGADICKIAATPHSFEDTLNILSLITEFSESKMVTMAMGLEGQSSRLLCPLVGGQFTYAALKPGLESAAGQPTVAQLVRLYEMIAP
jgi:3-dehydroquinate dehydratase type I